MQKKIILFALLAIAAVVSAFALIQRGSRCSETLPANTGYDNVNADNVIIDGYDVVAFFTERQPVKGAPEFAATYQSTIYWFANEANKATFLGDPEKYRPQYGGWCAVAAAENHIQVISVDFFEILNDRLYLNHNARAKSIWDKNPQGIVKRGDRNWPCLLMEHGHEIQ